MSATCAHRVAVLARRVAALGKQGCSLRRSRCRPPAMLPGWPTGYDVRTIAIPTMAMLTMAIPTMAPGRTRGYGAHRGSVSGVLR
eukprot:scaffold39070_cov48-Phaeocystis_antarctica.AAC.1